MKRIFKIYAIVGILVFTLSLNNYAGNPQRAGEAGASFLLINPWASGAGWAGANTARCLGTEATFLNVAGSAFTQRTDIIFSHTQLYSGADINLNAFGFSQKVGDAGVLSLTVTSLDYGENDITTVFNPEGGVGTFHPQASVIGISFAKEFSNSIFGGASIKILSESISNVASSGVAIDAGIQYVTGSQEQVRFGISMKNVGPTVKFQGDGISFKGTIPETEVNMTLEQRSAAYELPSLITIGASYDFNFSSDMRLTPAFNFTSNAFSKDQFNFGVEFAYKDMLFLRGGYLYEDGIGDLETSTTLYTGLTYGLSLQIPLNKESGTIFALDYSYRATNPFLGVHSIGARISL